MERKHCLGWIALSMIAAALLTLLCLILNDHAEVQAVRRVEQMATRVRPADPSVLPASAMSRTTPSRQQLSHAAATQH
ncbi:hypothetical protein AU476_37680 [Cupriavidus sp. UYMSc13B]|uniref:hypothetical protein n=1 Tax=Cupriavidus sp. UYPR2.512 TaxID=1080187 RepID=UPI00035D280C|nr:hypothetical protein [Cupriavidus sp. UYPR2.512]RWA45972.1 hypothetical protein AU476_37680 [Cupriavidus sp. UYMSc13B]UIF90405.1 hypothetical protein KAF44_42605 [Cupriavidus necator]